MALATTEADRLLAVVDRLDPDDWTRPTDCTGWDVKALLSHMLGSMEGSAGVREFVRTYRLAVKAARASGGPLVDELTARHVDEHAVLAPEEIARRLHVMAPKAIRGRRRPPALLRRLPIDPGAPLPKWTLGYLLDVIIGRDNWMHRVDLCRATGQELVLTAGHDSRIVADVVAEWARAHGRPFRLVLDGPAGGRFAHRPTGQGVEAPPAEADPRPTPDGAVDELQLDAVEFCRIVSGRGSGPGLLAQEVTF
jgi:uncharacterized protein (TIGR03083 family)